jgi:hypothetical protein
MVLSSEVILAVFILFDNSKEWLNGIGDVSLYYSEINSKSVHVCQIHYREIDFQNLGIGCNSVKYYINRRHQMPEIIIIFGDNP